jgi:hypothetical protein
MSDLARLFDAQTSTKRWVAEQANATARLELARIDERIAYLISQHDPIAQLKIDREHLRIVLQYLKHGDLERLKRDIPPQ